MSFHLVNVLNDAESTQLIKKELDLLSTELLGDPPRHPALAPSISVGFEDVRLTTRHPVTVSGYTQFVEPFHVYVW